MMSRGPQGGLFSFPVATREGVVRYMVIETFLQVPSLCMRAAGPHAPGGLTYVDSWIDERLDRCFQLMETDDPGLFEPWIAAWSDLAAFEVVLVVDSAEAARLSQRKT